MKFFDWILSKCLIFFYTIKELNHSPIEPPTPQLVAKRFRQLFVEHGIEETRIPRVFPKITLDDLSSDQLLIKKLTPELINQVAELFNVRSEWLDGVDETIYNNKSCYKNPEKFFKILKSIKYSEWDFPFRVVTSVKKFDSKDESYQPFSILYVEKIAELGDEDINRYYLDVGWTWDHWPCRIQLKAMAFLYWSQARHPITIYTVPRDIYQKIVDRQQIPYPYLTGALVSDPSLEDYISDPKVSVVAKEFDEHEAVYKYIDEYHLSDMKIYKSTNNINIEETLAASELNEANHSNVKDVISEMNRKNAKARYESLDKIKEEFKQFFISNNNENKSQAARDFFNGLSSDQKKLVVPTYYEKNHKDCLVKAVRNLTKALNQRA